jgi:hypothetical protein
MNPAAPSTPIESPFPSALPPPTLATSGAWAPLEPPWSACRHDHDMLACPRECMLPPHCVKCGGVASERRTATLYWHSPWLYLLVPVSVLLYAIFALVVRKKAVIEVGLCAAHVRRRRNGRLVGWLVTVAGLATMLLATMAAVLGGLAVILAGLVTVTIMGRLVTVRRMDDYYVWLGGVHRTVLARLPHV